RQGRGWSGAVWDRRPGGRPRWAVRARQPRRRWHPGAGRDPVGSRGAAMTEPRATASCRTRVAVGEDEPLLREGLRAVLEGGGLEVVATVGTATELVATVEAQRPDLVITDIRMPPGHSDDGLAAALQLRSAIPDLAVVVLSQHLQRS